MFKNLKKSGGAIAPLALLFHHPWMYYFIFFERSAAHKFNFYLSYIGSRECCYMPSTSNYFSTH